jgi:hypothetical protein
MNKEEQSPELKKANARTALVLAAIAVSSLCVAAYGVSKTLGMGA